MKKAIKNTWDILTDEEKEFAPHWAMVMFGFPILLVAACALSEWLNSLW